MLLKYFYDTSLAHASYLVGCQRSKTAIIVDPGRDVEAYLDYAKGEGLEITAVAETHIHADYVSGARELADRTGAKLYVSDEGPAAWKYEYLDSYNHQRVMDGDEFKIGNLLFEVLHTPGHTPESISFLLTDQGGGADAPMGIFTGDFIFVGSIGRPDLLEEAAGLVGTADSGARDLYRSVKKFTALPDYLQVWPAHGAGSACGKGLGAIPSSTVGYEKKFNPALQFTEEESFVNYILADQPEAPKYFANMKRVNKEGPALLKDLPQPQSASHKQIIEFANNAFTIDLSAASDYQNSHLPGSINIPLEMLAAWAGWILDENTPVYLLGDESQFSEATRILHKIGIDNIQGYLSKNDRTLAGNLLPAYKSITPETLQEKLQTQSVQLIDVRSDLEWKEGIIAGAVHDFLGRLNEHIDQYDIEQPIVTQCLGGPRAAIAASLFQRAGFETFHLTGGYNAWKSLSYETAKPEPPITTTTAA